MKLLRVVVFSLCCLLGRLPAGAIGGPDIVITLPPLSQSVASGHDASFTVIAVALGYLEYQWLHGGKPIPDATNATLTLHNVKLRDAGNYVARIIKGSRLVDSASATLTVDGLSIQDLLGPTLTVQTPGSLWDKTTNAVYWIKGTATDNASGLAQLFCQHDNDGWQPTSGGATWALLVSLQPGTNHFSLKASDRVGNESSPIRLGVFFSMPQPLSLQIDGDGQVAGPQAGEAVEIGKSYLMRAVPNAGSYFKGWTVDGQTYTNQTISVLASSNLSVRAEFLLNSLIDAQGNYVGLFYDTNTPAHESAGLLTCRVTPAGKVTGRLLRAGQTLSFAGQFGYDLLASLHILRPAPASPISVDLRLFAGSGRLTGLISDGVNSGVLEGYRNPFSAVTNPATTYAGRFTVAFSGSADAASSPFGHGYGVCTVTAAGTVTFTGKLADGSTISARVPLAANGQWPLYASLYQGKGSLFGWVTLAETSTNDVQGLLQWTKGAGATGVLYPGGFTNQVTLLGSRYAAPAAGLPVLDLPNPVVTLDGGNLTVPLQLDVVMDPYNRIAVAPPNALRLSLKLSVSSGLLMGSFLNPDTLRTSALKGIILQKQNAASGWFLGTNQSGSILLEAVDQPLWFDVGP